MSEAKKRALIVTALAGFVRSFLTHDIELLKDMGYEVHCAANIHHPGAEGMEDYFNNLGVVFHQIDFSSNRLLSRNTLDEMDAELRRKLGATAKERIRTAYSWQFIGDEYKRLWTE
jgi:hypothetical protein